MDDSMSDQVQIRVVVVDDLDMVRRGLAAYLKVQPDLSLIGEAGDGMQAVELCLQLQPDVVLMDFIMPGMGGIEATRLIREQNPAIQVVALTSFQKKSMVQDAIRAGALHRTRDFGWRSQRLK